MKKKLMALVAAGGALAFWRRRTKPTKPVVPTKPTLPEEPVETPVSPDTL